jgi:hypothetical protein
MNADEIVIEKLKSIAQLINEVKEHDEIKNNFCNENNVNLIRISYINFNNIKNILSNEI